MAAIEKPIFCDPVDLGTITAGSALTSNPVTNLNRLETMALTWKTSTGTTYARGQFTQTEAISFLAILSANAQSGTTYRLRLGTSQAQVDGTAPYDSGTLAFISPSITRDDGLYNSFLDIGAVTNATWWRIDIAGHSGAFEAGGVVMGEAIEPARFYDKDFERGVEDLGSIDYNRFGVPDVAAGVKLRTLMFTLSWLSEAEYEDTFAPLAEKVGTTSPIYCCFDPAATTYRQRRTYFGCLGRAPYARGSVKPRTMAMEFQIRSLI